MMPDVTRPPIRLDFEEKQIADLAQRVLTEVDGNAGRERSRPEGDRSSLRVSPTAAHLQGCLHRKGELLRLVDKHRYGVTLRA